MLSYACEQGACVLYKKNKFKGLKITFLENFLSGVHFKQPFCGMFCGIDLVIDRQYK